MTFHPCPKPVKASEKEKNVDRLVKARSRQNRWRDRAITRAKGKPRPKVKERNEKRIAKKAANYRKVIGSPFNKELRYRAYRRSGGFCECEMCHDIRSLTMSRAAVGADAGEIERAHAEIPCWFTRKGSEPHLRFRSKDGELHHESYAKFGDENPDELRLVRWVWKSCHQRIEGEHGTRRRFLKGR